MKDGDDDVVAGDIIWHDHPFKYLDMPPYFWSPLQSYCGWMQQGGLDAGMNYQITMVHEVTLIQGHQS